LFVQAAENPLMRNLPRVVPCLLLKGRGLTKTVRFKDYTYVGDPLNAVRIFNEKEVDELMFIDIMASREGAAPRVSYLRDIASECFMPLSYGGGIDDMGQIEALFRTGVEKVSLNSAVFSKPELVSQAAAAYGSQSVVVTIDARRGFLGKYQVFSHGGTVRQQVDLVDHLKRVEDLGAGEIIVNSIDRDGLRTGYDLTLLSTAARVVSIPVVALGGAGELRHLGEAVDAGASAVAAGSLFVFYGKHRAVLITYPSRRELVDLFGKRGVA
jgi:cyclase